MGTSFSLSEKVFLKCLLIAFMVSSLVRVPLGCSSRVFSGLAFSGFSSFRAFQNFVRVSGRAFGLLSGSFQALKA